MANHSEQSDLCYADIVQIGREACTEAGKILLAFFNTSTYAVGTKFGNQNNLVTQADLQAQQCILRIIRRHFPHHSFLAEEDNITAELSSPYLWIIDPLDGTNNFAHRIPHFSISIAFAEHGVIKVGIVYDVTRQELFSATGDSAPSCNNIPISVSRHATIEQSMIATGFYYDRAEMLQKTIRAMNCLFMKDIRCIRRMGSAALDLAWVACGRYDGYFEYMLSPWDFAAGMFIVEQGGGICTDRNGLSKGLHNIGIISTNGAIHSSLVSTIKYDII